MRNKREILQDAVKTNMEILSSGHYTLIMIQNTNYQTI